MMKYISSLAIVFFITLLIISCDDATLEFEDIQTENYINTINLENGKTITRDDSIFFEVFKEERDVSYDVKIILYDASGESEFEVTALAPENNIEEILDLSDVDMTTGEYTLEFILLEGESEILKKTVNFFYMDEDYSILGIESFPPVIYPGIVVELKAFLDIPEFTNPYLRWKQGNNYINPGHPDDEPGSIYWHAPEEEGVYSINLELFPIEPAGGIHYRYTSSISMDVELFVSKLDKPTHRNLYPAESYFALFHFDGDTLNDSGGDNKPADIQTDEASLVGKPVLILKDDDLGYKLDENSGLSIPASIFPIENNQLTPFTLSIGIELSTADTRHSILNYTSRDGSFYFDLFIDEDNFFSARLKAGESGFTADSGIKLVAINQRFLLSLSVIPGKEKLDLLWFYDGVQVSHESYKWDVSGISLEGETRIGNSFTGIIDELGVYFKDSEGRKSIDPALFKFAVQQKNPEIYVFADGFDGLYLPSIYDISGTVSVDPGIAKLQAKAALSLPELYIEEDITYFSFVFSGKSVMQGVIRILSRDRLLLEIPVNEESSVKEEEKGIPEALSYRREFKIDKTNFKLIFPFDGDTEENEKSMDILVSDPDELDNIIMEIAAGPDEPLLLDNYVILYEIK